MIEYAVVALFLGILFTVKDVYLDLAVNKTLTINIPIILATHVIFAIPLMVAFIVASVIRDVKNRRNNLEI